MIRTSSAIAISILLLISITATPVVGNTNTAETTTIECDGSEAHVDIEEAIEIFESNTDSIPSIIKPALAANTTHLKIENANNNDYTIKLDDSLSVTQIELGEPNNPDVIITTTRDISCELATSEDPVNTFNKAYENDKINIEHTGAIGGAISYAIELIESLPILNSSTANYSG